MKRSAFFFSLLLLALPGSADTLRVGAIYGITGTTADLGNQIYDGARFYIAEHPNSKLRVVFEDHRGEPNAAVAAFHKLVAVHSPQVVHVLGSSTALAIKPIVMGRSPMILFSLAAHPDLVGNGSSLIRHGNLSTEDAKGLVSALRTRDPKTVAWIAIENDWGRAWDTLLRSLLPASRADMVLAGEFHGPADTDVRATLTRILAKKPDVFVVASQGMLCVTIYRQLRELGYTGDIVYNTGLGYSVGAQAELRKHGAQRVFIQRYPSVTKEFAERFSAVIGKPAEFPAAASYTDLELLDAAIVDAPANAASVWNFISNTPIFRGEYLTLDVSPRGDITVATEVVPFS